MPSPLSPLTATLMRKWQERTLLLKAFSFGVVGVVNSAVDFGIFALGYYGLGLPIIAANTLAWMVAVTGSYVMNSTITFAAESGRRLALGSYFGFALSQAAGFLANTATVWCLVELFDIPAWAAKVAAIAVSFTVNFSLSHFVVFRRRPEEAGELRDGTR